LADRVDQILSISNPQCSRQLLTAQEWWVTDDSVEAGTIGALFRIVFEDLRERQRPVDGLPGKSSLNLVRGQPLTALLKCLEFAARLSPYHSASQRGGLERGSVEAACLCLLRRGRLAGRQFPLLDRTRHRRPNEEVGEQSDLGSFHFDLAKDALLLVKHGQGIAILLDFGD